MTTINGKPVKHYVEQMVGELSADRPRPEQLIAIGSIIDHYLGLFAEEVEKWRAINRQRFVARISYGGVDATGQPFTIGEHQTCNLCNARADTGKGETLTHEFDCPIKD